jgi:hypothetical protein
MTFHAVSSDFMVFIMAEARHRPLTSGPDAA